MNRVGDGYQMEAVNPAGNVVVMDNPGEAQQAGASPMELLLMGVAGCSSIDIIAILEKQSKVIDNLRVTVDAERDRSQTPSMFSSMQVNYYVEGKLLPTKVKQAVKLSMQRYCTVAAILEKSVEIEHAICLNGEWL